MNEISKESVTWVEIGEEADGQRVDNYLIKQLKGVPKSHVYRILRSGEVRVNSKRVDSTYRLTTGDRVRIPPVRTAAAAPTRVPKSRSPLAERVLFEDESLIALDKPAGLAVHGGSGISLGVVEQMRAERPQAKCLELVHRLDRDTSGVLLLAKKRSALTGLHEALRDGRTDKRYLVLVLGKWPDQKRAVKASLVKYVTKEGERRVRVDDEGQAAHTIFRLIRCWPDFSLLEAELKTGRTHQIRVHLAHIGYPIAGDDKYGDFSINKHLQRHGLKRMALHASRMTFRHPTLHHEMTVEAPMPEDIGGFIAGLDAGQEKTPR